MPLPQVPDITLLRAEKARRSLYEFVRQAWPVVEPGKPFVGNWHIEIICEHLEAITRGEIKLLLINIPPRCSKSTIVSVMWPMWEWITRPHEQYLCASYAGKLSIRDSVKARRLITSPWYQNNWASKFSLTGDQNEKIRFENDKSGYRLASSVGGTATGEGGSRLICLKGDTLIQCAEGLTRIDAIVNGRLNVNVLGFNHVAQKPEYRKIARYEKGPGRRSVRIKTRMGREVVLTHDHQVYVIGTGYQPAERLQKQARVLLCVPVPHAVQSESIRATSDGSVRERVQGRATTAQREHRLLYAMRKLVSEGAEARGSRQIKSFLQSCMPGRVVARYEQSVVAWGRRNQDVPYLREGIQRKTKRAARKKVLLFRVFEKSDVARTAAQKLFGLWERVRRASALRYRNSANLFSQMRERTAFGENQGLREWPLRAWQELGALPAGLSTHGGVRTQTGQVLLPLVRHDDRGTWRDARRASYRLREREQPTAEPDHALPLLPRHDARWSAESYELGYDVIETVEIEETPEYVYNVAVEGTHNYFANGVLLHNCDDPHGAQDAQSDAMRETAVEWFDMVWSSRLNDPKKDAMVTIMQRLHEEDVSGHILKDIGGWEHICIPAEWDGVARTTSLGVYDPRKKPDELMWPERMGTDELGKLKKLLGAYGASGQLQQDPSPPGGGILRVDRFRLLPHAPACFFIVQSLDTAYTEQTINDPTAFLCWGVFKQAGTGKNCVVLLDAWDDYLTYPQLRTKMVGDKETGKKGEWLQEYGGDLSSGISPRRADVILIEKKGSGIGLSQDLQAAGVPVVTFNPGNADKINRAHQTAPIVELDVIYLVESEINPAMPMTWARRFVEQCRKFPVGAHDDYVDAFTQAMIYLRSIGIFELAFVPPPKEQDRDYYGERKKRANPYDA